MKYLTAEFGDTLMEYILRGHEYHHEVYTIIQLFYHNEKYIRSEAVPASGVAVESSLDENVCRAVVYADGRDVVRRELSTAGLPEKPLRNCIKKTVWGCLSAMLGETPPWGILTGIRPTKKAMEYLRNGLGAEGAVKAFEDEYCVSYKKARMCVEIAQAETAVMGKTREGDVSLYVGIPFCPTRCLYCSFTSYPIAQYADKADEYVGTLIKEIGYISEKIKSRGERTQCIYIGGGTPTSLNAEQTERLLMAVVSGFDIRSAAEYCCEAGRPDTITPEKLRLLKKYGVTRLSVNPQTLNQATLDRVGRRHSVSDFTEAYNAAKAAGFDDINVDLIIGLPGESVEDVRRSVSGVLSLEPASVTVHTLCVKRATQLNERLSDYALTEAETVGEMLDLSYELCKAAGLSPYYMYRQKNALGNLENIGYARPGRECIYNIRIMEENQTVYAAGAGAVTKVLYGGGRIERAFNVKNVDEYIDRLGEMLERKEALL
jgi:oxygen-independent coproporphyrinogen-3 oxidase